MAKLVYNIEPASPSMIASLNRHCLTRVPDGTSNIAPERSHLNQVLEGDERGLVQSLQNFYAGGVQKPAKQSEKPYLRIVLSASPEYFRPDDPAAVGTWSEDRLTAWIEASMTQLREEHGADLVFAELHLDEDTPHIHAVVAPTYLKKPRKPGRKKRGETPEQFEERKALALASMGVRTVGRASHATLSKQGSFQRLRERMTVAVDHLGIEYGEDRTVDAPAPLSTREWVKSEAARLRKKEAQIEEDRLQIEQERRQLAEEQAEVEKMIGQVEHGLNNLQTAIDHVQAGTYDTAITSQDMADQPQEFAVLKAAAPDNQPTLGFGTGFWALNDSRSGKPKPLPEKIRSSLTKAFDRVARWADEVRKSRVEARNALTEAQRSVTEAAERVVTSAEREAAQILQEARQHGEALASVDNKIRGWAALTRLIKEKIKSNFGEAGYQKVADAVNEAWHTHPDNPNPPAPKSEPEKSIDSGPSGP